MMNFLRRCSSLRPAIFAGMRHVRQQPPFFAAIPPTTPKLSVSSYNTTAALNTSLRERFFASSPLAQQPKPDESTENDDAKSQKVKQKWTYTDNAYKQVAQHRLHANGVNDPTQGHDLKLEGAAYDYASARIEVHKRILVAASPYFSKKLANIDAWSNPSNGDGTQCVMPFDHGNLKRICDFIYTGTLTLSDHDKHGDPLRQLYNTLDAAKLLEIPELEAACVRALLSPTFFNTDESAKLDRDTQQRVGQLDLRSLAGLKNFYQAYLATIPAATDDAKRRAEEHKERGNQLVSDGKENEAINEYNKAIDLDKKNAVYYGNRAAAYTGMNRLEDAIRDCHLSLAADPKYVKAFGRLGVACFKADRLAEAKRATERALELDPGNERCKFNLALIEARLQQQPAGARGTSQGQNAPSSAGADNQRTAPGGGGFGDMGFDPGMISGVLNNPQSMNMAQQVMGDPRIQQALGSVASQFSGADIIDTWMYAKARGNKVLLEKVVRKFAKIFPDNGQLGEGFLQLGEVDAIGVLDELKNRQVAVEKLSKAAISWLNANWPLLKHDVQDENGDDAKNWDALEYMLWYAELSDDFELNLEQKLLKERKPESSDYIDESNLKALHKSRQVDELTEDSKAYRAKLDALRAQKRELRQELLKSQLYEFAKRDSVRKSATFRTKCEHKKDDTEIVTKVGEEVKQAMNAKDEQAKQKHVAGEESSEPPPKNADEQVVLSRREIGEIRKQLNKLEKIFTEAADTNQDLSMQMMGEDSFGRKELGEIKQKVMKLLDCNAEEAKVIEELSRQAKAVAELERRPATTNEDAQKADEAYVEEAYDTDEEKKRKRDAKILKLMLSGKGKEKKTSEQKVTLPRLDLYRIDIPLQALRQFNFQLNHMFREQLWQRMKAASNEFTRRDIWVMEQIVKQMHVYHVSSKNVIKMLLRHLSAVEARWESYTPLIQLSRKEIREMNEQVVKLKTDCLESEKINEKLLGRVRAAQERRKVFRSDSAADETGKPVKD